MAYTDNHPQTNNILKQWYYYFSDMYLKDYKNFRFNESIHSRLDHIIQAKKESKRVKELVLLDHLTKKGDLHLISSIVIDTMTSKSPTELKSLVMKHPEMEKFFHDLRYMYEIIQHCIKMMDYLHTKYDYLYVEHWRNKEVVQKYINSAYEKYNKAYQLFETAKYSCDLLTAYDQVSQLSYDGLMITEYIRLMNEDALDQGEFCNPIHIFNISMEYFEPSWHERCEQGRREDEANQVNYDEDDDYHEDYNDYNDDYDEYDYYDR